MCLQRKAYETNRLGGMALAKDDKQPYIYRVIQEERSIFWEVIIPVIVRKLFL
jgi:hypothetical protein